MIERIVVVGGGGFGRETLDVIDALIAAGEPLQVLGVIDMALNEKNLDRLRDRGVAYLGTEESWLPSAVGDERFVIAVGSPRARAAIADRFSRTGLSAITLIHPRAVIGSKTRIGLGAVIASGVQLSTNVSIGDHTHLNPGCIVGHDSTLEDFVSVNPGAVISGDVVIASGALLGAGSVVLQGLRVGAGATIGAAACATRSVDPEAVVVGVPARPIRSGTCA